MSLQETDIFKDLKFQKFETLNGQGYVCLVDGMGDESAIVQAARVSYGEGTKTPSDDATLIRYLMRHRHTTPLEMVELKFLVYVPMDCWRQWIRHRTASVNEYSTRYSEAIDDKQVTPPDMWRLQSSSNKQGSSGYLDHWPDGTWSLLETALDSGTIKSPGGYLSEKEAEFHKHADDIYQTRLKLGVAREQARKDLPLSTFTKAYWKIDLHNLLHFLSLRMDSHAQAEIREYACTIGEQIVAPLFPNVWQAFLDYRLNAITLTGREVAALRAALESVDRVELSNYYGFSEYDMKQWNKRERTEFLAKLKRIGWPLPESE